MDSTDRTSRDETVNPHDVIPTQLKAVLPDNYDYVITSFSLQDAGFTALLEASAPDAMKWKQDFEESSKCTWRVQRTHPCQGQRILFKKDYRCHHGQQRKMKEGCSRHMKDTGCSSSLQLTVRRTKTFGGRLSRSTNPNLQSHPAIIKIVWNHNHAINIPSALRFRDVNQQTCEKLEDLFRKGHSPSSALNVLEMDLQTDPESYILKSGDRSLCPDLQFCFRLYYKIFNQTYGASDGDQMIGDLDSKIIAGYNEEAGSVCIKMEKTDEGELVIAICTPIMKRVHTMLKHSGELVFIDSTGNVDRHGSRVFQLLTHSNAGGLPLGVMICSNEAEKTIQAGLKLFQSVFPGNAFFGKGDRGPQIFITDDCLAERKALSSVYPDASLLLCTFHILQAVWRWLWDGKHNIEKCHRQSLFNHMKQMVYAPSIAEVDAAYDHALSDPLMLRYSNYKAYIKGLHDRKEVWAHACRLHLMTRGNNTNNYAEAAMRVLKDSLLHRTKAFNVPQLLDFLTTRMEAFYQRKLVAVANQRTPAWRMARQVTCSIKKEDVTRTGENMYTVRSQSEEGTHAVDMKVGVCTCFVGRTGGACKHQEATIKHFNETSTNFLPSSSEERALILKIATGNDVNVPFRWLESLQFVEPMVGSGEGQTEPSLQDVSDASGSMPWSTLAGSFDADSGDDFEMQPKKVQDPQLVRIQSLEVQRDFHNAFDRRLHGGSSSGNEHLIILHDSKSFGGRSSGNV
ncbi:uncharacterized protein LOC121418660 isoform X2 [Lytechinus variegatus]|uniref:uncharacterized protein LOC121418660 isoform X2 n=1 Tax=Lytechinus variegatus TaxID=7654 RepID=UPI001BB16099|nr:uncharacterized protein LOC121418660 isoform X2 [Lytechinus variegatus]